jgi:hypothetical protein
VYEFVAPSESGMKGRKTPSLRRGKNRRGRRSRRGGSKRRALAGAAPKSPVPTSSERRVGSSSWARRARHKQDYSRALIRVFCDLSAKKSDMKRKVRSTSGGSVLDVDVYRQRLNNLNGLMTKCRRSWLELAKTSGDSPEFCNIRHRLLVSETKGLFNGSRPDRPDPDWYGELILEPINTGSNMEERPADHIYECARCMRTTNLRVCRLCGAQLTNANRPVREKRRGARKPLPSGSTSTSQVTERKPARPIGYCEGCGRIFKLSDGHSTARCLRRRRN